MGNFVQIIFFFSLCNERETPPYISSKYVCACLCMCVLVAQSCLTLCDPMDCSPPDFSVHGILQARILEWVAIPFSRGSSGPRDWTRLLLCRQILY